MRVRHFAVIAAVLFVRDSPVFSQVELDEGRSFRRFMFNL
jgi:hypothetical protein